MLEKCFKKTASCYDDNIIIIRSSYFWSIKKLLMSWVDIQMYNKKITWKHNDTSRVYNNKN